MELRQAFLGLVKGGRQVRRSLGRQQWEDSSGLREKGWDTHAEAGDFLREAGHQKASKQGSKDL